MCSDYAKFTVVLLNRSCQSFDLERGLELRAENGTLSDELRAQAVSTPIYCVAGQKLHHLHAR